MSQSDAVLWSIERDRQLRSTITAVSMLDRPPDQAKLRRRIEATVDAVPRLRQRVVDPPLGIGRPRWVDDADIDLAYHVRTIAAPPGDDYRWLLDFAAAMAGAGFDRDRPLWELVIIEGLGGGRSALVQKVHHSLTDGIGGIELMLGMLDRTRSGRATRADAPPGTASAHSTGTSAGPAWAVPRPPDWARSMITDPVGSTTRAWRLAGSVARLLSPGGQRRSPVLRGHSTRWRFDTLELPLTTLRRAGEAAQGTINDAFLAAIAGGLRRYHLEHGADVAGLRLTLPVSLRGAADPVGSNHFTPVRFVLPIGEKDTAARIRQVGELSRRWRHEPALPLTDMIAMMLNQFHPIVTTAVMGSLLKGTDFVATNVPGVPFRCYLAGAEVLRQFGFAPLSGAAINVALVSHAGTACIGVNMDCAAVADPDVLVACLHDGFNELHSLAIRTPRTSS